MDSDLLKKEINFILLSINTAKGQEVVGADGVVYKDVGPMTAKRYQDQIVLLHLLLAQEHDQVAKQALPEYNLDGKGVPFTLTAQEIRLLNEFAEKEIIV